MLRPADTTSPGTVAIEVRSQLDVLRRSHPAADVLDATRTLVTLAQNLVQHPADPKRHRVRIQNKAFFAKVGRLQDACSIMESMGFRRSADGDFFEAKLGIGAGLDGGVPGAVAAALERATAELNADILEEEISRERMHHALAERRKRKKEQDERWSQAWAIAGPRLGKGHWGGGLGGTQQKLPRHSSGFVGLSNQGATCYLNSLLQCLYHNALLRSALSQMTPVPEPQSCQSLGDSDAGLAKPAVVADSSKFLGSQVSSNRGASHRGSIPDALRAVFDRLSFDKLTVDTKVLTDAFGWDSSDAAMQQDAHETLLLLLDAVESRMTPAAAGILNELITFQLEYRVTLEAPQPVERHQSDAGHSILGGIVVSTTVESNRILSLDLLPEQQRRRHQQSVSGALGLLTEGEVLEGENAYFYDGGGGGGGGGSSEVAKGLQSRAHRGCKIVGSSLPPVLFANICRFTLDRAKNNSLLAVESALDLSPFLTTDTLGAEEGSANAPSQPTSMRSCCTYELSAVLMHAGTNAFGHYWSYVRARAVTEGNGAVPEGTSAERHAKDPARRQLSWLAFNDATVSVVTEAEVLRTASGGEGAAGTTSAYMLVYVRSDCVTDASALVNEQAEAAAP